MRKADHLKTFTGLVLRRHLVNNQLYANFVTADGEKDDYNIFTKLEGLEYLEILYLEGLVNPDKRRVGHLELTPLHRDIDLCGLPLKLPKDTLPTVIYSSTRNPKWRVSIHVPGNQEAFSSKLLPC